MQIIPLLLKEFEKETATTRQMLELVPDDQFSYKPHEKSMTMQQLTTHIAELPGWVAMGFSSSEMDFASTPYVLTVINSRATQPGNSAICVVSCCMVILFSCGL